MILLKRLYKYIDKAEYAEKMLSAGEIRIGTLYSYRAQEQFGDVVGDAAEGIVRVTDHYVDEAIPNDPARRTRLANRVFKGGTDMRLINVRFTFPEESADYFLYCVAYRFSGRAARAFRAVSCIVVTDPGPFLKYISNAMTERGHSLRDVVTPCTYTSRTRSVNLPRLHPASVKGPEYSYQREVRMIFDPTPSAKMEPFNITIPEIRRYLRVRPLDGPKQHVAP
ncbi:MAG TPA: hypothetical protein VK636_10135 [Gemmatimonadaceae bacterium]|nr:hypothetical protein [Gemmatimonadaceae bacterium]